MTKFSLKFAEFVAVFSNIISKFCQNFAEFSPNVDQFFSGFFQNARATRKNTKRSATGRQRGADSEGPTAEGRPSMAALLAAPLGLKPAALCDLLGGLLAPLPLDVEDGERAAHSARHSADGLWKLEL